MIDNASVDGSREYVAREFPWVKVIHLKADRGFAGGVNTGIKFALERGFEFIAVFSNDIKVVPRWRSRVATRRRWRCHR